MAKIHITLKHYSALLENVWFRLHSDIKISLISKPSEVTF